MIRLYECSSCKQQFAIDDDNEIVCVHCGESKYRFVGKITAEDVNDLLETRCEAMEKEVPA